MEAIQRRDGLENREKSLSALDLAWRLKSRINKELQTLSYIISGNPVSKGANKINQVNKRCNYI